MSDSISSLGSFYDFEGLARLRAGAAREGGRQDTAAATAAEFESAFFLLVFKAMQQAGEPLKSDLLQSQSMDFFQDLMLTEVSHFVAQRQSLGVAKWLDESMARQTEPQPPAASAGSGSIPDGDSIWPI